MKKETIIIVIVSVLFWGGMFYHANWRDHNKVFPEEVLTSVNASSMEEVEWFVSKGKSYSMKFYLVRNKETHEMVKVSSVSGKIEKAEEAIFVPEISEDRWISRE